MSLLSSLLEYSGGLQPSSLLFCQSPKEQPLKDALEKRNPVREPQRNYSRPSKSLTKMSIYSLDTKIDPKERLLHRLAYKLQMKCRKHYYNFFVKLENIQKKSVRPIEIKTLKDSTKFIAGVQKLSQLQAILFSKYFQIAMKKLAFQSISQFGSYKVGLSIISNKFAFFQKQIAFTKLFNFSKKMQKNQMRIQILCSSAQNVVNSKSKLTKNILRQCWNTLFQFVQGKKLKEALKNVIKEKTGEQNRSSSKSRQNTGKFTQIQQIYNALKSKINSTRNSPCRLAKNIQLLPSLPQSFAKRTTFLKAYDVKTELTHQPYEKVLKSSQQNPLSKRCENDPLTSREVNDIYDNNTLFFPFEVSHQNSKTQKLITQSSVKSVHFEDNCFSQFSFVAPLSQLHQNSRVSSATKNGKNTTFGSDAVSFKNSLVYERESMKMQDLYSNVNDRKDETVQKAKNFIKQSRKIQQEWAQESQMASRAESRYQSAQKALFSSKAKNRRQSTGSFVPPYVETMPFSLTISPHVHIAEHDYGKGYQTNRTSKAQSIASNEKESGRRTSFIKITKKG